MKDGTYEKVKAYIAQYGMISPGDTVVVGVSGGADSVCLFVVLCELAEEMDFRLAVVHVNHGIRQEAGKDADYVRGLCEGKGIPFLLVEEDVRAYAEREHLSEEEAGRKVRYRAFEEVLEGYAEEGKQGRIAVAHNANDRAETMLFHLFRGTGLTGAGGIRPVRGKVIRPVLCLQREEIEEYLKEKGIPFCIDITNAENTYTRNRIRSHILPFAEQHVCSGAVAHMCEAADLFMEADAYIRRQAEKAYQSCVSRISEEEMAVDVGRLMEEDSLIRNQVLLQCLEALTAGRKDIASVHMKELGKLLQKQGSKELFLPYGWRARKEYGRLTLYREKKREKTKLKGRADVKGNSPPEEIMVPLEKGKCALEVPGLGRVEFSVLEGEGLPFVGGKFEIISEKTYTEWLDYDRITRSVLFRTRETGDYLTINKEMSRKKLKDYMIEEKIPRAERGNLYVLADGSHIIWVPGHRISEYYKITGRTKRILKIQLRGGR